MKTVRLTLRDSKYKELENIRLGRKTTIQNLINQAVEQMYPDQKEMTLEERLRAVRAAFGVWWDREDIRSTDEYVRKLRDGTGDRMRRLGLRDA